MTERWELVELIGQTLLDQESNVMTEDTCEAILDAIEDLIRADEQEQVSRSHRRTAQWAREAALADLLAKVLALEEHIVESEDLWVRKDDVLALFNGSNGSSDE